MVVAQEPPEASLSCREPLNLPVTPLWAVLSLLPANFQHSLPTSALLVGMLRGLLSAPQH